MELVYLILGIIIAGSSWYIGYRCGVREMNKKRLRERKKLLKHTEVVTKSLTESLTKSLTKSLTDKLVGRINL